jgi:hypothetical protein
MYADTYAQVLGTTALLVSSFTVLLMLALSDIVIVPRRSAVSIKRVESPKVRASAWLAAVGSTRESDRVQAGLWAAAVLELHACACAVSLARRL